MTKIFISTFLLTSLSLLTIVSCSSKKQNISQFSCKQDGVVAPKWTCNPYSKNNIAALGIAKQNTANDKSMQRSEAMADGRDALASQIQTKVSNLFKSYKATTGSDKSATFDASTSKVSKQLASQTLSGSRAIDSWRNPFSNELYLLIIVSNKSLKQKMNHLIKTSYKNDEAMHQKLEAAQASGELDRELEKAGL